MCSGHQDGCLSFMGPGDILRVYACEWGFQGGARATRKASSLVRKDQGHFEPPEGGPGCQERS